MYQFQCKVVCLTFENKTADRPREILCIIDEELLLAALHSFYYIKLAHYSNVVTRAYIILYTHYTWIRPMHKS